MYSSLVDHWIAAYADLGLKLTGSDLREVPKEPRPVMGWAGLNLDDKFIRDNMNKKFIQINQTHWLYSHSGMKVPTQALFDNVIRDRIVNQMIKDGGGFGTYIKKDI